MQWSIHKNVFGFKHCYLFFEGVDLSFGFHHDDHDKSTDLQAIKNLLETHEVITQKQTRFISFDKIFPNSVFTDVRDVIKNCLPPWINTNDVTFIDIEQSNKIDVNDVDCNTGSARHSTDGMTSPVSHVVLKKNYVLKLKL